MGFGGVGWDVNVRWHLLHEVDATLGMETFAGVFDYVCFVN